MKTSGMRRALALANIFNLLVAIYFIVISITSLVHLRWYHQLTVTTRVRHIITSTTSYFAFLIILAVAVVLVAIFVLGTSKFSTKIYISSFKGQDAATSTSKASEQQSPPTGSRLITASAPRGEQLDEQENDQAGNNMCPLLLNLIAAIGMIVIIVVWLLNTGELVRDSISTQLDYAFARYQFSNRSNHYSVAIDAMQNINNCCGSLDYTDFPHFPHQRLSGLSPGHYPGSCCGKTVFGAMARVLCSPEEIVRARQTTGCTVAIANHYDLVSLLVVPVALVSLFVCIMVMAMMTLLKNQQAAPEPIHSNFHQQLTSGRFSDPPASQQEAETSNKQPTRTTTTILQEKPVEVDLDAPAMETVSIH